VYHVVAELNGIKYGIFKVPDIGICDYPDALHIEDDKYFIPIAHDIDLVEDETWEEQ
jgi:hypothetical protein